MEGHVQIAEGQGCGAPQGEERWTCREGRHRWDHPNGRVGSAADVDTCSSVSGFQQRWWTPVDRPPHQLPPTRRTLPV